MTQEPTPTADTVRRLVRTLLKDEGDGEPAPGPEVRPAGDGAEPATWWVGTRQVLRLALDRETSTRRRRELRLRELVRPHIPVAVPSSVAHGEWAPGLICTLDTRLAGGSAEEHRVSAVGETDLAGLLTGLRGVPVRQAETLGVPRVPPRSLEALRRAASEAAERLAVADEFAPRRMRQLTPSATVRLTAQPGSPVLVHHGLTGAHLVVSADGRVRGVLGWAGAVVGDPAEDIAGLALAVGSPAAVRAATLAGYGPRPCLRGLWLARCDALLHLAEALRGGATGRLPLLRVRLRRAWEAILLERVTDLGSADDMP
ncbi:aminoglycoside phosphotransferase family protein [Streptomyces prasinopilosus]|uniref:Predicted kinase, aminoglycoside phosphotransferase (APT) family n=2 Tax=Streptomyces prasinopilosus TaxID=67344 RepID=A0A1G6LLK7_9ACTN|nr:aminoglycoside phosphotransferase family protein [Streptomyces prasinopilosus]SDC43655.1 Predicted kinase, aminoglycoside phosphotransferase (APT) family [Streptomyces prasinopilosus]